MKKETLEKAKELSRKINRHKELEGLANTLLSKEDLEYHIYLAEEKGYRTYPAVTIDIKSGLGITLLQIIKAYSNEKIKIKERELEEL